MSLRGQLFFHLLGALELPVSFLDLLFPGESICFVVVLNVISVQDKKRSDQKAFSNYFKKLLDFNFNRYIGLLINLKAPESSIFNLLICIR
jgi:hypothetical protein